MNRRQKNNQGAVLLLTLMILSGILVVSLGAASLVMLGIINTRLQESSVISYYAAETGIEKALWETRKNNYDLPDNDQLNLFSGSLANGSSYSVDYASSTPVVTFTSVGSYKDSRRVIEVSFSTQ